MLSSCSSVSFSADMRDRLSVSRVFNPSRTDRQLGGPFLSLDVMRLENYHRIQQREIVAEAGTVVVEFVLSGAAEVVDPALNTVQLKKNDVFWVMAGAGAEYLLTPTTLDFVSVRLTLAVSAALQSLPTQTNLLDAKFLEGQGPAQVVLGYYSGAKSGFTFPSLVNYFAVKLKKGQEWVFQVPVNHGVVWSAVVSGCISANQNIIHADDIASFNALDSEICFLAEEDTFFMLGTAQEYEHHFY